MRQGPDCRGYRPFELTSPITRLNQPQHPEPSVKHSGFSNATLPVVVAPDKSNGYEEIASIFISGRGGNHSGVGASVVADWSQMLPDGATVLDLGCGNGVPISEALIERGFNVY